MAIEYDPGLRRAKMNPAFIVKRGKGVSDVLDFSSGPNHTDPDEADRKKRMAMLFAMRDKAERPYCPYCHVRKVARIGGKMGGPLDSACGTCAKLALAKGPKHMGSIGEEGQRKTEYEVYGQTETTPEAPATSAESLGPVDLDLANDVMRFLATGLKKDEDEA